MTAVPPPFNIVTKYTATSLDDGTKYYLNFPLNYNIVSDAEKDKHSTTFKAINIETKARYLFQTRHPEGLNGYLVLNPLEPVDKWVSTFVEINDDDDDEDEDYWVCDCGDCNRARINKEIKDAQIKKDQDDFCEDCDYGHCPEHKGDYETDEDEDENNNLLQFEIVESFDDDLEDFDYDVKSDCSDDSDYEFEDDIDDEDDNDYDVEESDDDDVEEPEDYEDGYPIVYVDEDESELQLLIKNYEEKSKYNFIRTERTLRNKTYTSTIKQKM